jgi:hypothetical protein
MHTLPMKNCVMPLTHFTSCKVKYIYTIQLLKIYIYIVLCCVVLCCVVLCFVVLCCVVLCCVVLCCAACVVFRFALCWLFVFDFVLAFRIYMFISFGRTGNHDTFNTHVEDLVNKDGSFCSVNGRLVDSPLGPISGLHGIINEANPNHDLHMYRAHEYLESLDAAMQRRPQILLSHTPIHFMGGAAVTADGSTSTSNSTSNSYSTSSVSGRGSAEHTPHAPICPGIRLHLFGHSHFKAYAHTHETGFLQINMDARIFVFE